MEMLIEKKEIQKFRSMTQIDDKIYFLSNHGNELWLFDIKTGILKSKCKLSEKKDNYVLCRKIIKYNDILVFVPNSANDIYIYDSRTETIRQIPIPDISIPYNKKHKFSNAFFIDNKIYFLPFCYPAILVMDTDSWQVSVQKIIGIEEKAFEAELFSGCYALQKDKCYVPSALLNEVLEIDINTYEVKNYSLGRENTWYGTILFDGEYFWLTGGKNTITRWDIVHDMVVEYAYPENFVRKEGSYPFLDSIQWMNKIILIPDKSNMFIKIDIETGKIENIHSKQVESSFPLIYTQNEQCKVLFDNVEKNLYILKNNKTEVEQIKLESGLRVYIRDVINDNPSKHIARDNRKDLCGNKIYSVCNMEKL